MAKSLTSALDVGLNQSGAGVNVPAPASYVLCTDDTSETIEAENDPTEPIQVEGQ